MWLSLKLNGQYCCEFSMASIKDTILKGFQTNQNGVNEFRNMNVMSNFVFHISLVDLKPTRVIFANLKV